MLAQWDGVGADARNKVNQLSVRECNGISRDESAVDCCLHSGRTKHPALVRARTDLTPLNHRTAVDKCDDASG